MKKKICTKYKHELPINKFYKDNRKRGRYLAACKNCQKTYSNEQRKNVYRGEIGYKRLFKEKFGALPTARELDQFKKNYLFI